MLQSKQRAHDRISNQLAATKRTRICALARDSTHLPKTRCSPSEGAATERRAHALVTNQLAASSMTRMGHLGHSARYAFMSTFRHRPDGDGRSDDATHGTRHGPLRILFRLDRNVAMKRDAPPVPLSVLGARLLPNLKRGTLTAGEA